MNIITVVLAILYVTVVFVEVTLMLLILYYTLMLQHWPLISVDMLAIVDIPLTFVVILLIVVKVILAVGNITWPKLTMA